MKKILIPLLSCLTLFVHADPIKLVFPAGITVLSPNFSVDYGDRDLEIIGVPGQTIITDSSNYNPAFLDVTQADLNPDGIYVVTVMQTYSMGGGFLHLTFPYNTAGKKVLYTQGTVVQKINGVWSRYYTGYGFKTSGNLIVRDIIFQNCSFYLFSPFGKKETSELTITGCTFNTVARVISSCLFGGNYLQWEPNWYITYQCYPDNGNLRFTNINMLRNKFWNISTSIIWGCPPAQYIRIIGNEVSNCPSTLAWFTLYMKNQDQEDWFSERVVQEIRDNNFHDIIQKNNNWTVSLIRTSGYASITRNVFHNITPQITLLYGGNSTFEWNDIIKIFVPKETPSSVIMTKNIGSPVHIIRNNLVTAPSNVFVAVEGTASFVITGNIGSCMTVFNKQSSIDGPQQFARISNNDFTAAIVATIASDTLTRFGSLDISNNIFHRIEVMRGGATKIAQINNFNNQFLKQ